MTLYVLCGIPGSGKTTEATRIALEKQARLYSYDTVIRNSHLKYFSDICMFVYQNIHNDLRDGHNIVYDAPNTKVSYRKDLLESICKIPCKKILIVMNTSLNECIDRNAHRDKNTRLPEGIVYNFYSSFEPPTLCEGWDEIIYIKDGDCCEFNA